MMNDRKTVKEHLSEIQKGGTHHKQSKMVGTARPTELLFYRQILLFNPYGVVNLL